MQSACKALCRARHSTLLLTAAILSSHCYDRLVYNVRQRRLGEEGEDATRLTLADGNAPIAQIAIRADRVRRGSITKETPTL